MRSASLLLLAILFLFILSTNSTAFTLSGDVNGGQFLGGITYIYAVSLDFSTIPPNIYIGLNLLGVGGYSISGVEAGDYILFSYQDRDNNLIPSADDYFGYYGGTIPEIISVTGNMDNLDILIQPLPFTTITGEISYSGQEEGLTLIEASTDPEFENIEYFSILLDFTGNGQYTVFVNPGQYYIRGYVDVDMSFSMNDEEPNGYFGAPGTPELVDVSSSSASGIDFILYDDTMPDVEIVLVPESQSILIPFWGGSFDFNMTVRNNETTVQNIQVWTEIVLPNGNIVTPVILRNITMAAGMEISRGFTQQVPASAPWGEYTYRARVGIYPDVIYAQDSFLFEKGLLDGIEALGTNLLNSGK